MKWYVAFTGHQLMSIGPRYLLAEKVLGPFDSYEDAHNAAVRHGEELKREIDESIRRHREERKRRTE